MNMTRRQAVAGFAGLPVAAKALAGVSRHDVIIIGAGVFGAWTAEMLRRAGKRVLLVDAIGPAHTRASSGGESRMTRGGYGRDAVYTKMAFDSLAEWKRLSDRAGLPVFHNAGVLTFYHREEDYAAGSQAAMSALGLAVEQLSTVQLARRWPQIDWTGVSFGLFEPQFGALMARRGVETLVAEFVRGGGTYLQAAIVRPRVGARLDVVVTTHGESLAADSFVFACGPWLPKLFPALIGPRIFPTRQEIFFFAPPPGDDRFGAAKLPGWADFDGDFYYGFPDLEGRGFKIANDAHGPAVDPDTNDRRATDAGLQDARAYIARRFPALAGAQLTETRVCQYENSANGDFLIDRHPEWPNVALVGGGSGHGFKHGPEVGRLVAALLDGGAPQDRFTLASKATRQQRAVH